MRRRGYLHSLLALATAVSAASGAYAAPASCAAWENALVSDVAAYGSFDCMTAHGMTRSVQSVQVSHSVISLKTSVTGADGTSGTITASASARDLGNAITTGINSPECSRTFQVRRTCTSGECVSQVDDRTAPPTRSRVANLDIIVSSGAVASWIDAALRHIVHDSCAATSGPIITAPLRDGNTLAVIDFVHDARTLPDHMNHGRVLLSGALGHCLPGGKCGTNDSTGAFSIFYLLGDGTFDIELRKAPLQQARLDAQRALMSRLQLIPDILCQLKSNVSAAPGVDSSHTPGNLGMSFCPGAAVLN